MAMKVLFKESVIVLLPESDEEKQALTGWHTAHLDHVLNVMPGGDRGHGAITLYNLGAKVDACREPINIVSDSANPIARLISNLAPTPFELDGQYYASVEAFWQGLKFDSDLERARLAKYDGVTALREGRRRAYGATIMYKGDEVVVGTWAHWHLMERACRAKFEQNALAQDALLATGERPLLHVVRRDSKTIPGVVMAAVWTRIRRELRMK
ncbi:MAG: NADAR family protein [Hyphomicrobium sp.]|nr:MAG: NADAR family protein [Hyphomicrobium sp.]